MRKPRRLLAPATLIAAALLLTACGGTGATSSRDTAKDTAPSPSSTASPTPDAEQPDLSLPGDLTPVFDFEKPSDGDSAAGESNAVKLVRATFCEDQSKVYGAELKSGKVLRAKESPADYPEFSIVMASAKNSPVWRAQQIAVTEKTTECRD